MAKDAFGFPFRASGTGSAAPDGSGSITTSFSLGTASNVNTGTDDTIYQYDIPHDAFQARGDIICVRIWGITASNGNSKTIKLKFGTSTTLSMTTSIPPTSMKSCGPCVPASTPQPQSISFTTVEDF